MHSVLWALSLIAFLPAMALGQGRIEQFRKDATGESPSRPKDDQDSKKRAASNSSDSDDDEDAFGIGELFGSILFSPFSAPRRALADEWDDPGYFPNYPYFNRQRGYLFFPDHDRGYDTEMVRTRRWSVRIAGEEGNDFRGMNRVGIRASIDTASRFGIQSNWNILTETLDCGCQDTTVLSDTNLTFRFAQSEIMQFHAGLGVRVLTDSSITRAGANLLYGFDLFPTRPVTISGLFDLGNVGSAFILHGRATVGANWRHWEMYTGYDFMRIGSVNVQGPTVGLRFWY